MCLSLWHTGRPSGSAFDQEVSGVVKCKTVCAASAGPWKTATPRALAQEEEALSERLPIRKDKQVHQWVKEEIK